MWEFEKPVSAGSELLANSDSHPDGQPPGADPARIKCGELEIDRRQRLGLVDNESFHLTPTEMRIIEMLIRRAGRTVTRRDILAEAFAGAVVTSRTIDVHIRGIRRKLGAHSGLIQTVYGQGYRVNCPRSGSGNGLERNDFERSEQRERELGPSPASTLS